MTFLLLVSLLVDSPPRPLSELPRLKQEIGPLAKKGLNAMEKVEDSLRDRVGPQKGQHEQLRRALTRFPRGHFEALGKLDLEFTPDNPPRRAREAVVAAREALDSCIAELLTPSEKPLPADATKAQRRQRQAKLMVPQLRLIHRGEGDLRRSLEMLSKTILGRADKQPTAREKEQVQELMKRQAKLEADTHLAIVLVSSQEADAPFQEVTSQVLRDIVTVKQRLDRGSIDPLTLSILKDVEDTLKELIDGYLSLGRLKENEAPAGRPLRDAFPTLLPELAAIRSALVGAGGDR
jgi:hypothetical protein